MTEGALLAVKLRDPDARARLEEALQVSASAAVAEKPRLQAALARLLWPVQPERARTLARAAITDLPAASADAAELKQWLQRHDVER